MNLKQLSSYSTTLTNSTYSEGIRISREQSAHRINIFTFWISCAYTVIFYILLGGNSIFWCALFGATGLCLELTKKAELETAAVTFDRPERLRRKFIALVLTLASLFFSLGSALTRASAITNLELVSSDTSSLDDAIANNQKMYETQLALIDKYPSDYTTARRNATVAAGEALAEIQRLQKEKTARSMTTTSESKLTMFESLGKFFGVKDYSTMMVVLLMFAATGLEIGYWATTVQYWKTSPAPKEMLISQSMEKPVAPEKAEAVKPQQEQRVIKPKQHTLF